MWILLSYPAIGLLIAYLVFRSVAYDHAKGETAFQADDVGMLFVVFIAWPLFTILITIEGIVNGIEAAGQHHVQRVREQLKKERKEQ